MVQRCLVEKAQELSTSLNINQSLDYDILKATVLQAYELPHKPYELPCCLYKWYIWWTASKAPNFALSLKIACPKKICILEWTKGGVMHVGQQWLSQKLKLHFSVVDGWLVSNWYHPAVGDLGWISFQQVMVSHKFHFHILTIAHDNSSEVWCYQFLLCV